jgi:uncharacterized glyoxalase superfamily protein PhnB
MREVKIGIRVADVAQAMVFYQGLGFELAGTVPGPAGSPVLAVMVLDRFHLILDALVGLPFPDTERERMIKHGPRGLGCVIGIEVSDLAPIHQHCVRSGCEITSQIQDQPWGERSFTCIDPHGYEWKFAVKTGAGDIEAVAAHWFGERTPQPGDVGE